MGQDESSLIYKEVGKSKWLLELLQRHLIAFQYDVNCVAKRSELAHTAVNAARKLEKILDENSGGSNQFRQDVTRLIGSLRRLDQGIRAAGSQLVNPIDEEKASEMAGNCVDQIAMILDAAYEGGKSCSQTTREFFDAMAQWFISVPYRQYSAIQ